MKKILYLPLMFTVAVIKPTMETVSFNVRGVHCPQCVDSIVGKVKDISGVKTTLIKDDTITIQLDEEDNFSLRDLKSTVEKNSVYKIKHLSICARGSIMKKGSFFYLENPRNQEKIYLMKEQESNVTNEEKRKKTNAFIAASSKAWKKTSHLFTKMVMGNDTFEKDVLSYYKNNIPVILTTCIHEHATGSFWASSNAKRMFSSAPPTKLTHIKAEHKGTKNKKH